MDFHSPFLGEHSVHLPQGKTPFDITNNACILIQHSHNDQIRYSYKKFSNQNVVYQVRMKPCKCFITNVRILDKRQQSQRDPSIGTPRLAHK
jgi:hypothetical protein